MTIPLFPEDREKEQLGVESLTSTAFGTPEFRQAYQKYINSSAWKKLCKQVRTRSGSICERCHCFSAKLGIHHVTYERFHNELLDDLQALCPGCHDIADQEREAGNRKKFETAGEQARYNNAEDTYMTKKYGENWVMHYGQWEHEEFREWIQRKRDERWYG
jgi:hypothetical protein